MSPFTCPMSILPIRIIPIPSIQSSASKPAKHHGGDSLNIKLALANLCAPRAATSSIPFSQTNGIHVGHIWDKHGYIYIHRQVCYAHNNAHICGNVSFIAKTPRAYLHTDLWVYALLRIFRTGSCGWAWGHYRTLPNVEDSHRAKMTINNLMAETINEMHHGYILYIESSESQTNGVLYRWLEDFFEFPLATF